MPVIVAANPKGGSGKSTSCLVLATTLAQKGATVRVIDADPQRTLATWSEGASKFKEIVVAHKQGGEELTDLIDRLDTEAQFVFIDVQGSSNVEMAAAMSRADFVVIPMQAKTADASVAVRAIALLRQQEKLFRRAIPHAILFVRNNVQIPTKEENRIRQSVRDSGLASFKCSLNERTAFSHMFEQGLSVFELSQKETTNLQQAQDNATALTAEFLSTITAALKGDK